MAWPRSAMSPRRSTRSCGGRRARDGSGARRRGARRAARPRRLHRAQPAQGAQRAESRHGARSSPPRSTNGSATPRSTASSSSRRGRARLLRRRRHPPPLRAGPGRRSCRATDVLARGISAQPAHQALSQAHVALVDGIDMGGGVGVSRMARHGRGRTLRLRDAGGRHRLFPRRRRDLSSAAASRIGRASISRSRARADAGDALALGSGPNACRPAPPCRRWRRRWKATSRLRPRSPGFAAPPRALGADAARPRTSRLVSRRPTIARRSSTPCGQAERRRLAPSRRRRGRRCWTKSPTSQAIALQADDSSAARVDFEEAMIASNFASSREFAAAMISTRACAP